MPNSKTIMIERKVWGNWKRHFDWQNRCSIQEDKSSVGGRKYVNIRDADAKFETALKELRSNKTVGVDVILSKLLKSKKL